MLKAALLCICPIATMGSVVAVSPKAKSVVHRLTAPAHASASSATRSATVRAAPCEIVTAPITTAALPVLSSDAVPLIETFDRGASEGALAKVGGSVGALVGKPGEETIPPAVPEPDTWVTLVAGFGVVGAAMRNQKRRKSA